MDSAGISPGFSTILHNVEAIRSLLVRQLLPDPIGDVDPLTLYPFDERPATADRPWVMVNMVTSADGGTAVDGASAGLGGEGDLQAFRAIRASCDWIVAAAGTVRAERYRIPRPSPDVAAVRQATGRSPVARLAVVTASVNLGADLPLFADQQPTDELPLVITGNAPPADRVAELGDRAEWTHLASDRPSPGAVIDALAEHGARIVLFEGGPSFNGELFDTGLVDELCLSVSPHLVSGGSARIAHSATAGLNQEMRLDRLLEHENALFARYIRS